MTRPSWDRYFMDIAHSVAQRSTCPRANVGCVLVLDNRILTTGFNGSGNGLDHCTDVGCMMVDDHCVRTVHAEQNAIIQAARAGVNIIGANVYCTHYPCLICAKMLINADVWKVFYASEYPDEISKSFFEQADIQVTRIER